MICRFSLLYWISQALCHCWRRCQCNLWIQHLSLASIIIIQTTNYCTTWMYVKSSCMQYACYLAFSHFSTTGHMLSFLFILFWLFVFAPLSIQLQSSIRPFIWRKFSFFFFLLWRVLFTLPLKFSSFCVSPRSCLRHLYP